MNRLAFMTDICGVRFGGLAAVVSFGLEGPDVPRKSKAPGELTMAMNRSYAANVGT